MRKIILNLFLSSVSILFCLLAGEIALRVLGKIENPKDSWSDRPKYYFNPQGAIDHTGQNHKQNKTEGAFRIGVVGDSYSFAPFMQSSDTFAKKLEKILQTSAESNSIPQPEVINYGISGYSTTNEIDLVKRAIAENSDLVILQITLNDAEIKPFKPEGRIISFNRFGAITSEPDIGIFSHSKLISFVYKRIDALSSKNDYKNYFYDLYSDSNSARNNRTGERVTGFELFQQAVLSIKKTARKSNVKLVAVVFPLFGVDINDQYPFDAIHTKLDQFLTSSNIPHIDLKEVYRNIPSIRLQVIPGIDFHPNEIAHRMAAEEIYVWLFKNHLIPENLRLKTAYQFRNHLENNAEDQKFAEEFLNK